VRRPDRDPRDGDPGPFTWGLALISLALPWIGLGLVVFGGLGLARGEAYAWLFIGAGGAAFILDVLIDFVWARFSAVHSDEPGLNVRAAHYVDQIAIVEVGIVGGRGKVRIGDTLWLAEGPDLAPGAQVRVTGARGTVLSVERVDPPGH
jgi:hypothetical protein